MTSLLVTTTSEKQVDAAIVWDPLGGNPVASLSGDMASKSSITGYFGGVACAAARKPIIQTWNFNSATSAHKNILTKGLVSAFIFTPDGNYIIIAFDREIYVYQTVSGCLVGVLEGSHSARIYEMKLSKWNSNGPAFLVSTDIAGFLACWSLGSLINGASKMSTQSATEVELHSNVNLSRAKHLPLWYVIQASTSHPVCAVMDDIVVVGGSQGLKIYALYDGCVLGSLLTNVSGGLLSLCPSPDNSGNLFCGGNEGLLYTANIQSQTGCYSADKEIHRCFSDSNFSASQKAITMMAMDPNCEVLVVGARFGLIEILRPDSLLTCIQRFSVFNPSISNDSTNTCLTGLCLIPRPDWLSNTVGIESVDAKTSSNSDHYTDQNGGLNSSNPRTCFIEPFKSHFGWRLDDTVCVRIPGLAERSNISSEEASIFMDDFYPVSGMSQIKLDSLGSEEHKVLRQEIDRVAASNRELLRRLVNFELRSSV
ncbi:hypothetical protein Smp_165460 [Schistosoma mansoni]|uniref:WD_REPEATS_REGION domain-containing protein n=1 Tax=Schistosoma mansoni TaxID=6183 RepID=G4VTP7_SCHMA|nr:hypothetical protein Smp_165460 [Schistosoma mansoni]|eukprot:XP_018654641.1 hypothetical protein Smp_165460 [Schistosoma mansoni]